MSYELGNSGLRGHRGSRDRLGDVALAVIVVATIGLADRITQNRKEIQMIELPAPLVVAFLVTITLINLLILALVIDIVVRLRRRLKRYKGD